MKKKNILHSLAIFIKTIIPYMVVALIFAAIVYAVTSSYPRENIENLVIDLEPKFILPTFALIIILSVVNFKKIHRLFSAVSGRTWIFLLIIFLLGFVLRMYVAPHTHRVLFDEDIYLDMGKEILTEGKNCLCNYGDASGCRECIIMKWPVGHPFVIAVAFFFFGISEAVGYNLVILLGSLTTVVVFLLGYLLFKRDRAALYAALLFALVPVHIMWSASTASEPTLVFFTALAVFFILAAFAVENWKMDLLAFAAFAYAVQIKSDAVVMLLLFPVALLLLYKNRLKKLRDFKFLLSFVLFLALVTPYLIHTYYSFLTESWGSEGQKFAVEYAKKNIPENAWFWINGYKNIEHPFLITAFAVVAAVYLLFASKRIALFLIFWFGMFFVLYGFFYAGSVRYGSDVRYALSGYTPLVLLGGFGLFFVDRTLLRFDASRSPEAMSLRKKHRTKSVLLNALAPMVLVALILLSFLMYFTSVATPAVDVMEGTQARTYHDFAVSVAPELADNCYILSHVPSIFLVMGKNSLQTWNGQNSAMMNELFERTDCVIFDDGYWCNLEPYKSSVCKHMFDSYELKLLDTVEEKTGHTYTFYLVEKSAKNSN
jgi:4-amino-4-deoxy-L-arabinose transferase-like glycosyltransferase